MFNEDEYYEKLIREFTQLNDNCYNLELWKTNQIRELMVNFHNKQDSLFIKNALLIIMALFDQYLKDSFYLNSKSLKKLNENDKYVIVSLLKQEYNC